VGAVADGQQRHGPPAVGDAEPQGAQGIGLGGLVQQQMQGVASPGGQQAARQPPQGQSGAQAVVGQETLAAALDTGGPGGTGDGQGQASGLALSGDGHAEGEVGQGFGLVAVYLRQHLSGHGAPPVTYNGSSVHGALRNRF